MRRLFALLMLLLPAFAGPRVGLHEGFTRLVFDLPEGTRYALSPVEGGFVLRLKGVALKPTKARVGSPELGSYQVQPENGATKVLLFSPPGVGAKTFVLEGLKPGTFRLVVDLKRGLKSQVAAPPPKPDPPRPVVVLDPGHGGPDPGANHVFPGLGRVEEEDVTLAVALKVKRILEKKGIRVVLTRDRDTDLAPPGEKDFWKRKLIDLDRRARMADPKKTVFVSIHVNSAPRPARGVETYVLGRAIEPEALRLAVLENGGGAVGRRLTRETETLADKVLKDLLAQANLAFSEKLAGMVEQKLSLRTGSPNRGVKRAPLYVLRYARIPAILVEIGFINHPSEGRALARSDYQNRVAEGVAEGILDFLSAGAFAFK